MRCAKLGLKFPSGSGEEDFKKFFNIMYFLIFCNYLHFEKGMTLHLKKKYWIIFTQECFVPTFVEVGPVVLEKKIFNSCQFIFFISQLSAIWDGLGPSFEQTWILLTQGCFVPSLIEIDLVVLEKKTFKFHQCIYAISF